MILNETDLLTLNVVLYMLIFKADLNEEAAQEVFVKAVKPLISRERFTSRQFLSSIEVGLSSDNWVGETLLSDRSEPEVKIFLNFLRKLIVAKYPV